MQKTLTRKPCRILVWRPRDSRPKAAESMLESRNIHARRRRFSCSNSTKPSPNTAKIMLKSCGIHAETQPERCRPPMESRADAASLLRIPNAQRARGVLFDDTKPAQLRATSHHRRLSSRAPEAPNSIAAAGRYRRLPNHNAASRSQITGKQAALPTNNQRRCDSGSRSFLCARALPQRSRLRFRAANEFSWWRQSTRHRRTAWAQPSPRVQTQAKAQTQA